MGRRSASDDATAADYDFVVAGFAQRCLAESAATGAVADAQADRGRSAHDGRRGPGM